MVSTIKFSQFASGGDLPNGVTTVGLDGTLTINTRFNNPWTFLAPGSTASRPIPSVAIDGRLRFNTDTLTYEYYDTLSAMWVELSGSGTGTINPGVTNDIPFYPANGTTLSPLAAAANAVLVTSAGSVPSLSTTLPSGLTIPGASISSATITASTAALTAGSVVAAPVAGTDLTNKTYVDGLFASGVDSITGTTNQVIASSPTGNVTLSLPQDIATGSSPTFSTLTLSSSTAHGVILGQAGSPFHYVSPFATSGVPLISQGAAADPAYGTAVVAGGGTGNTTFTAYSVICAGTTASGAFQNVSGVGTANQVLVSNGAAALPTWQSVPGVTPAALTKTDDTNVTLTLGGTPATALLQATSLTLGWTGQLAVARGGTSVSSVTISPTATAFAGWDANKNLSANNFLNAYTTTATAAGTTVLTVSSTYQQYFTGILTQTVTLPVTSTLVLGQSFWVVNNSTGVVTVQSSGGNTVTAMATNTAALFTCILTSGTTAASWNSDYGSDIAGVVSVTGTTNRITSTGGSTPVIDISASYVGQSSIITLGTITTGVWTGTGIAVANGGTGLASATAYAVLCGGTTSTGAFQSIASVGTSGQILTSNGAGALPTFQAAGSVSGTLKSFQIFTSGTASTYTKPAGIVSILVEIVGGGGGGAGITSTNGPAAGGGGGSGGYARLWVLSASGTYTYTVGGGGNGGAAGANNGITGTTSTFSASSLQATGGVGGVAMTATNTSPAMLCSLGGTAGVGSNGDINANGMCGGLGFALQATINGISSGFGGSSIFGGGANSINTSATGANGLNFGGGGSGGGYIGGSGSTTKAGGNGAGGIIIVWEFS